MDRDLNLVVLAGRLAAPPEVRTFERGSRLVRWLVTTRSEAPERRVDVVPVTLWDPSDGLVAADVRPGRRIWAAGSVRRRFWSDGAARRSRLEILADRVCLGQEHASGGEYPLADAEGGDIG
ncbi:MAG: single-stranded DNA-binding protein [Acidimicrobiia bacterium]|nr:single-stranded DNA-binding protein [Acidimicrobiia bacterium]